MRDLNENNIVLTSWGVLHAPTINRINTNKRKIPMRNINLKPIVILALNQDTIKADKGLLSTFTGSEFTNSHMVGSYKGKEEPSYILDVIQYGLDNIIKLAKEHKQECILYLDNERSAYLYYDVNKFEHIGTFKAVHKDEALKHDGWTLNPETNQYYIVG